MCFKVDSAQISSQRSQIPKIPSGRPCQPFGRLSIKQHSSRRRGYFVRTPINVQKIQTFQGYIHLDVLATCPDAF